MNISCSSRGNYSIIYYDKLISNLVKMLDCVNCVSVDSYIGGSLSTGTFIKSLGCTKVGKYLSGLDYLGVVLWPRWLVTKRHQDHQDPINIFQLYVP